MNLDELEAKARAAKARTAAFRESDPPDKTALDASYEGLFDLARLCDPDTVLNLIERVRAGEKLYRWALKNGVHPLDCPMSPCCCSLSEQLAHWESLAHSPQEAV